MYNAPDSQNRSENTFLGKIFLLVFCLLFVWIGYKFMLVPEIYVNHAYLPTQCQIINKRLDSYRDNAKHEWMYSPVFNYVYQVNGQTYNAWGYDRAKDYSNSEYGQMKILDRYVIGQIYTCWYDPKNPNNALLKRGYSWLTIFFIGIPALLCLIVLGSMLPGLLKAIVFLFLALFGRR